MVPVAFFRDCAGPRARHSATRQAAGKTPHLQIRGPRSTREHMSCFAPTVVAPRRAALSMGQLATRGPVPSLVPRLRRASAVPQSKANPYMDAEARLSLPARAHLSHATARTARAAARHPGHGQSRHLGEPLRAPHSAALTHAARAQAEALPYLQKFHGVTRPLPPLQDTAHQPCVYRQDHRDQIRRRGNDRPSAEGACTCCCW